MLVPIPSTIRGMIQSTRVDCFQLLRDEAEFCLVLTHKKACLNSWIVLQLCTRGPVGQFISILDTRQAYNVHVFWITESFARLEQSASCSQLQPFRIVPGPERYFHQIGLPQRQWQQQQV
jgi:hypothetical protein